MFDRMNKKKGKHTNYALLEDICCRDYKEHIRTPDYDAVTDHEGE